jgi:hypothetical protein
MVQYRHPGGRGLAAQPDGRSLAASITPSSELENQVVRELHFFLNSRSGTGYQSF